MDFESSAFANSATPARRSLTSTKSKTKLKRFRPIESGRTSRWEALLAPITPEKRFWTNPEEEGQDDYCTGVRRKACVRPRIVP